MEEENRTDYSLTFNKSISFKKVRLYKGEHINGVPSGKGSAQTFDGDKYIGEWSNGLPCGLGTIKFKDGSIFEGKMDKGENSK